MSRAAKEDAACMKKGGAANFIKGAVKPENKGKFKAKAQAAGKATAAFAKQKASAPGVLGKEARLATTLMGLKKAKGGSVKHGDAKADAKQIKSMVKPTALKSVEPVRLAAGGVARARLGGSTMDGQQKKPSGPLKSPIGKLSMPKSSGRKGMI